MELVTILTLIIDLQATRIRTVRSVAYSPFTLQAVHPMVLDGGTAAKDAPYLLRFGVAFSIQAV